jgi:xanthine/CO dehydrogenase XdhC/CoxF family maturation factor
MNGSETKAAKLRSRLNARGVDASRLASPIGLFKAGKHPA